MRLHDLGHDDVRRLIVARSLKSIPALMQALEWKTSCGCAKCRPALNYYLLATWPGEYEDDGQSRFINERVHANIQKDGTYSVVPRMWGGVTSAAELRAIADVVDKFAIPTVKVTGGQRIDLLGVRKEQLPAVWADLNAAGMISGPAYAKALRTVKTCAGSDWCRFGTQDSTGLGIKLETLSVGLVDAGEGQAGRLRLPAQLRRGDLQGRRRDLRRQRLRHRVRAARRVSISWARSRLCHADSEEETIEIIGALVQLYREQGALSRAHLQMDERVGADSIKSRSSRTRRSVVRSYDASSIRRPSSRSIPGPNASPARTRMSSRRSPTLASSRRCA